MRCKHENTRKLFWSNTNPNRWERTNFSICLDCGFVVAMSMMPMEIKHKGKSLRDQTKDALSEPSEVKG